LWATRFRGLKIKPRLRFNAWPPRCPLLTF
jgi:hypothetical protein